MVNLIYGSFATAVVALLTIDAVALILLLGAQVIAELERKTDMREDNGQIKGLKSVMKSAIFDRKGGRNEKKY